jgi:hypothetical protein
MAKEKSVRSQVEDLARVLARRRWQVLLPALYVAVLAAACAVLVPKEHVFQTRIEIQERRNPEDYALKDPQEAAPVRELSNVDQHIRHYNRVRGIVESSGLWPDFALLPPREQQRHIERLLENIDVDLQEKARNQGSTFVDITYRDVLPARAESFLVRLANTWIEVLRQEDLETLRSELGTLRQAEREVWARRQEAFARYADLAREMGLNPADPPDVRREAGEPVRDFQFQQLDLLRRDREATQRALEKARFELSQIEERYASEPALVPRGPTAPEERNKPEILRLQDEIETLQEDLARLTPRNKGYAPLEAEIRKRQEEIAALEAGDLESAPPVINDPNPFKEELRRRRDEKAAEAATLEKSQRLLAQNVRDYERKIDQRTEDYARLMLLWGTTDELSRQHEATLSKVTAKEVALQQMEAIYGNRPYESVSPPRELAIEPSALALALFGILAGLALGTVVALFLEYGHNAYRSVEELAELVALPVLGAVGSIVTASEERRARRRRWVVGLASAGLLGSIVWITGIWMFAPHLLPVDVERAIEGLRSLWT